VGLILSQTMHLLLTYEKDYLWFTRLQLLAILLFAKLLGSDCYSYSVAVKEQGSTVFDWFMTARTCRSRDQCHNTVEMR